MKSDGQAGRRREGSGWTNLPRLLFSADASHHRIRSSTSKVPTMRSAVLAVALSALASGPTLALAFASGKLTQLPYPAASPGAAVAKLKCRIAGSVPPSPATTILSRSTHDAIALRGGSTVRLWNTDAAAIGLTFGISSHIPLF